MNKEMQIFSLLMPLFILTVLLFVTTSAHNQQTGGWTDPYAWIRPWKIIDFFRTFPLTR